MIIGVEAHASPTFAELEVVGVGSIAVEARNGPFTWTTTFFSVVAAGLVVTRSVGTRGERRASSARPFSFASRNADGACGGSVL